MRVAFLHHTFMPGSGIDGVTYELAKRIGKKHEVVVMSFNDEYGEDSLHRQEYQIPFGKTRIGGAIFSPLFAGEVRRNLGDFDVVCTQLYPANIIPLLPQKLTKPKCVFIEWGLQPSYAFPGFTDKVYMGLLDIAHGYAIKHSDTVVVANSETEWLIRSRYGISPERMSLYGVDFGFLDRGIAYEDLLDRMPILRNKKIILYMGRITPHKNQHILIQSLKLIKSLFPDTKLVIVGRTASCAYLQELKKLSVNLGLGDDVVFTGLIARDDVPKYYALCDVFAYASCWEGYLNPEPLAMGKPVVAYDTLSHRGTIKDGETGTLVKELTSQAFAKAITELFLDDNLHHKLGESGYAWAKEHLDYDAIADNFVNFLEGIVGVAHG